jgi:hypothetical protein
VCPPENNIMCHPKNKSVIPKNSISEKTRIVLYWRQL